MPTNEVLFLVEGFEAVCILLLAFYLYKLQKEIGTLTKTTEEAASQ